MGQRLENRRAGDGCIVWGLQDIQVEMSPAGLGIQAYSPRRSLIDSRGLGVRSRAMALEAVGLGKLGMDAVGGRGEAQAQEAAV